MAATFTAFFAALSTGFGCKLVPINVSPVIAATSRAMPKMLKQSARFGVSFSVSKLSFKLKYSRISCPIGASAGSSSKPSASVAKPSSLLEHNMPNESTPRTLACLIEMPGSSAPTCAHGTLMPTRALAAPQTICNVCPIPFTWPICTLHNCNRSASGCFSAETISPITTWLNIALAGCSSSTSSPAIVKALLNSAELSLVLTKVRNQFSENCILTKSLFFLPRHSRLRGNDEVRLFWNIKFLFIKLLQKS